MSTLPPIDSYLSGVSYCKYMAMFVSMDAEWTRRPRKDGEILHCENHHHFRSMCVKYGNEINKSYFRFQTANDMTLGESSPFEYLNPCYYNPVSYCPLTDADDACLVLVDDHDAPHHLALQCNHRIEDIGLGYGIDVDTLGLPKADRTKFFTNLDDFLDPNLGPLWRGSDEGNATRKNPHNSIAVHQFQRDMPLLMIARFRMDGLCSIGHALICQHGMFRLMASEISRTMNSVLASTSEPSFFALFGDDAMHTKCAFIDIQRTEEISVLIFCRNFSIAAYLVQRLRCLRYDHLFRADQRIEEIFSDAHRSPLHRLVAEKGLRCPDSTIDALRPNHIFRWSRSSLFMAPQTYYEDEPASTRNCSGYIDALLDLQVAPGHEQKIIETLSDSLRTSPGVTFAAHSLFAVGQRDIVVSHASLSKGNDNPASILNGRGYVSLKDFIRNVQLLRRLFSAPFSKGPPWPARDLVEMGHTLTVPVPIAETPMSHNSALAALLTDLNEALCGDTKPPQRPMSRNALRLKLPDTGLPISLQRSIECLYQNYYTVLADSFLFDLGLDLYDSFSTLHNVVTRCQPLDSKEPQTPRESPFFDENQTCCIAEMLDAMQNALSHRLAKACPETFTWDMAIDFRGGLNQLLLAAAAPMTCGLGLLRKYAMKHGDVGAWIRDTVGVVTCVRTAPGLRAKSPHFQNSGGCVLGYFEADVPHFLHVASYADYFHEAGHLIFNACARNAEGPNRRLFSIGDEIVHNHVVEIFANFISHVLVFNGEKKGTFFHYIASFSRSITRKGM